MASTFCEKTFFELQPYWKLKYYTETDSTNARAKEFVKKHDIIESGMVFLADQQTAGVGRRGRAWHSEAGENLLFTVVIDSCLPLEQIHRLSLSSGLALAQVLENENLAPQIKLPNDIYIKGKKVAGILVEQVGPYTLIGMGVNVNSKTFTNNILATSLFLELGEHISREKLLGEVLKRVLQNASLCGPSFSVLLTQLEKVDMLRDQKIRFNVAGEPQEGIARGISTDGYLLVDQGLGTISVPSAYEIRLF